MPCAQTIHPYLFGDPWLKATCLWLKGLPPLSPTNPLVGIKDGDPKELRKDRKFVNPEKPRNNNAKKVVHKYSWITANNNHFDPTARARSFAGIATAMADQWGNLKRPYSLF